MAGNYSKDPYAAGGTYTRDPYGSSAKAAPAKKSGGGGFLHALKKYSGAQVAENLLKDVGTTAIGAGPGIYKVGKDVGRDVANLPKAAGQGISHGFSGAGGGSSTGKKPSLAPHTSKDVAAVAKQYKDYYGHDLAHHIYTHPLQPLLDAATVASLGAAGVAKTGALAAKVSEGSKVAKLAKVGERATIETRSPRRIATGKGPVHEELTSHKPLIKAREKTAARMRSTPSRVERRGGELQTYGKQIQSEAHQHAVERLQHFEPYHKATRRLSPNEWTALHIRAMDIHPDDLAQLWRGTRAESVVKDGRVRNLVLSPSKRMVKAEPELRNLSKAGERLYKQQRLLKDETAGARPDLTKRQASQLLERPVRQIHGDPYYFPHTIEPPKNVSPLTAGGGGKAVPRKLGSTKENTGALALHGKLHLRSDVLGPEFLRRVKYVKYDEIHNALRRGAVRVTRQQIEHQYGGKLPKGWEYLRQKQSTRIPPTIRGEGDQHIPIDKLIPNAEDLHDSALAKDGFSTTDPAQAHASGEHYYIVPKSTVRAATGEFTRSSDFTHNFVKRPLSVWRAAVLGLRVGFLTNNLVGNSIMYAAKTGGQGAFRDLFMAIKESHGADVAKRVLDDPATPPNLRDELWPMLNEHPPRHLPTAYDEFSRYTSSSVPLEELHQLMPRGQHLYHSTTPESLKQIARTGLTPGKDRPGEVTGAYFAEDGIGVVSLRPGNKRPFDVLLRAKKSSLNVEPTDMFEPGSGFAEYVSRDTVSPEHLEYLGSDDHWHSLVGRSSAPAPKAVPLRGDLYKQFFPEQIQGTFGRTQSPSTSTAHMAAGKVSEGYRQVTGAIPRLTSKVAEETPRKALIRHYIRHSPEFKRVYTNLPKDQQKFETAARRVLEGEGPRYQRYISKQVNHALGDYTHLSPTERNVLRNALPFYSWYRAIVTTTYHLAVDTPGRAAALAIIGRIGRETNAAQDAQVPSFLQGAIPLGPGKDGTKKVLATQGLNPYATLPQLERGVSQDYTSLGLNPFVEGPAQYLQYHRGNISPLTLALSPLKDLVKGLPPARLLAPPGPSKLYPTRKGRGAQVPGYLGVPVKEYDPNVAAEQKRQGR